MAQRFLAVTRSVKIPLSEIEVSAIRSQGHGGQNVNKVATAIQLQFSIKDSSLPEAIKERLLEGNDQRISKYGVLTIKAQKHRYQALNYKDALQRLKEVLAAAAHVPKKRKPTKPSRAAKLRRLEKKKQHGQKKALRRPVRY